MAAADIERAYRARIQALLDMLVARLERTFGDVVDEDDIDATFSRFAPQAAALVESAQAAGVSITLGYLRSLLTELAGHPVEPARLKDSPVGTNASGTTLLAGMASIPALIKQQIGKGRPATEALDYGRSLVSQFGDAETTRAIDVAAERVSRGTTELVGWEGIVSADACDGCRGNEGRHDLSDDMYRHPGCHCVRQWVLEPAAASPLQD